MVYWIDYGTQLRCLGFLEFYNQYTTHQHLFYIYLMKDPNHLVSNKYRWCHPTWIVHSNIDTSKFYLKEFVTTSSYIMPCPSDSFIFCLCSNVYHLSICNHFPIEICKNSMYKRLSIYKSLESINLVLFSWIFWIGLFMKGVPWHQNLITSKNDNNKLALSFAHRRFSLTLLFFFEQF